MKSAGFRLNLIWTALNELSSRRSTGQNNKLNQSHRACPELVERGRLKTPSVTNKVSNQSL
jgi:hypothetical protein